MVSQKYIEKNWIIKDHGHLEPKNITRNDYFIIQ